LRLLIVTIIAISTMWSCSKASAPGPGQQATVTLNDGSTFSGTITSSSTSAISLQGAGGETRTYPMTQVSSVNYGQAPGGNQPVANPAANPVASAPPPAATPAPQPPAAAPPPQAPVAVPAPVVARQPVAEFRTIPAGTTIEVRNNETIDSQTAQVGQTFSGVVEQEVVDANGRTAIPRGSNAELVVRSATGQGKLQGQSDLAVDVSSVAVGGRIYRLETTDFVEKGTQGLGTNKRTGIFAGGGAALGGIIGAVAGGGKGAAIGALSGAGAGTATQGLTRGKAVRIPSETLLSFKLESAVRIRELR
jgi:hypothetical protein